MGFYQDIRNNFGYATMRDLKEVAKINNKLATLRNRKIFLLQCRRHGLLPKRITTGVKNVTKLTAEARGRTMHSTLQFNNRLRARILNLEIKITHDSLLDVEKKFGNAKSRITSKLPYYIVVEFFRRQSICYNKVFFRVKCTNMRKFSSLKENCAPKIKTPDNRVKNLTDINIPSDVLSFLALGPRFSIEPKNKDINIPKFLADVDYIIDNLPNILH